ESNAAASKVTIITTRIARIRFVEINFEGCISVGYKYYFAYRRRQTATTLM
ncbi:unnamed protein product, partial [marine sediment metagenome]